MFHNQAPQEQPENSQTLTAVRQLESAWTLIGELDDLSKGNMHLLEERLRRAPAETIQGVGDMLTTVLNTGKATLSDLREAIKTDQLQSSAEPKEGTLQDTSVQSMNISSPYEIQLQDGAISLVLHDQQYPASTESTSTFAYKGSAGAIVMKYALTSDSTVHNPEAPCRGESFTISLNELGVPASIGSLVQIGNWSSATASHEIAVLPRIIGANEHKISLDSTESEQSAWRATETTGVLDTMQNILLAAQRDILRSSSPPTNG